MKKVAQKKSAAVLEIEAAASARGWKLSLSKPIFAYSGSSAVDYTLVRGDEKIVFHRRGLGALFMAVGKDLVVADAFVLHEALGIQTSRTVGLQRTALSAGEFAVAYMEKFDRAVVAGLFSKFAAEKLSELRKQLADAEADLVPKLAEAQLILVKRLSP